MNEAPVERSKGYAITALVTSLVLFVGVMGLIPSPSGAWAMPLWLAVLLTALGVVGAYGLGRLRRDVGRAGGVRGLGG